ncbi:MAG: nicotinate (nicotinamide) nucleotide adenylyltransferase [Rickettsiales bacterium]|nr:nicotinate (nicotinamide) nucleotide adenylyltransferase [Rickettsiales bacterium]
MNKLKKNTTKIKIGLLGGSFDPPHEGHLFISKDALKRFKLDYIWWIVAKQNTLKENKASNFDHRIKLCKEILKKEPHILTLDIEKKIKSKDTIDVLDFILTKAGLHKNYNWIPSSMKISAEETQNKTIECYWIMGSDSFFTFDKWPEWQKILHFVKIIVYDRTNFLFKDNKKRINPELMKYQKEFSEFKNSKLPNWTLVTITTPNISSTEIRLKSSNVLKRITKKKI